MDQRGGGRGVDQVGGGMDQRQFLRTLLPTKQEVNMLSLYRPCRGLQTALTLTYTFKVVQLCTPIVAVTMVTTLDTWAFVPKNTLEVSPNIWLIVSPKTVTFSSDFMNAQRGTVNTNCQYCTAHIHTHTRTHIHTHTSSHIHTAD